MRPRTLTNRALVAIVMAAALVLGACGGNGSSEPPAASTQDEAPAASGNGEAGDAGASDNNVDPVPAGQATASVDGHDFVWDLPGAVPCNIQDGEFSISFRTEADSTTLGAGGFHSNSGWGGDMVIEVPEPAGAVGVTQYFVNLTDNGDLLNIGANSLSYSGPWMMRPPNDGTNPPPVEVGSGTLSVTCP